MVKKRPVMIGSLAIVLLAVAVWTIRHMRPAGIAVTTPFATGATRTVNHEKPIPTIGLARLDVPRSGPAAGRRNLFEYGTRAPSPEEVAAARAMQAAPPVVATPVPVVTPSPAPAPALPQLNVKYVGTLELKGGLRVAVLMTDRKEILTGQAGEVVANRIKIVKIGYESIDVQDVGSDRVRRIPFKGN